MVPAGRGSGKSEIAKRKLVRSLAVRKPWPDPRYFFAAPTYDQAKRIAWNDLLRMVAPSWVREVNRTQLRITTKWGSELWVFGLERPERTEGIQWDGGVIDEVSQCKVNVFGASIYPAMTHRDGWCWFIGTPRRDGPNIEWYRRRWEFARQGSDPDWRGFTWFSSDILPADAIERAKETLDPVAYREQFEGSFESAGGRVYTEFDRNLNVRHTTYHPDRAIIVGSDFNLTPMAWVIGHAYTDPPRLDIFDEIALRDARTRDALNVLYNRYGDHPGGFEFYGDATGRGRRTSSYESDYDQIEHDPRFKGRSSLYYPGRPPARADRYESVNALFHSVKGIRRLFVDPKCEHLIDDLQSCAYDPGTREAIQSEWATHWTDALGYIVHMLYPINVDAMIANATTRLDGIGATGTLTI